MRSILSGFLFALLLFLPMTASRAGLDTASVPASSAFELVVVEAKAAFFAGCSVATYCPPIRLPSKARKRRFDLST